MVLLLLAAPGTFPYIRSLMVIFEAFATESCKIALIRLAIPICLFVRLSLY
jgi:hypothetical protein